MRLPEVGSCSADILEGVALAVSLEMGFGNHDCNRHRFPHRSPRKTFCAVYEPCQGSRILVVGNDLLMIADLKNNLAWG